MFMREYATGTYSAFSYFLTKSILEMPVTFAQTVVQVPPSSPLYQHYFHDVAPHAHDNHDNHVPAPYLHSSSCATT
jgi:hypothetical protein